MSCRALARSRQMAGLSVEILPRRLRGLASRHTLDRPRWLRGDVRNVIVMMGDAPPHTRKHALGEVAREAERVDPAHVFPIRVSGANEETAGSSQIAAKTGGATGCTSTAAEPPREPMKMLRLAARVGHSRSVDGRVVARMNEALDENRRTQDVRPGMAVQVFSGETSGVVIAEGRVPEADALIAQRTIPAETALDVPSKFAIATLRPFLALWRQQHPAPAGKIRQKADRRDRLVLQ